MTTTDTEAMDAIQCLLDGRDWEVDDLDKIASIVRMTDRGIADSNECRFDREELIDLLKEDWLNSLAGNNAAALHILMEGHTGFNNMSYRQLLLDATNSGLVDEEDED